MYANLLDFGARRIQRHITKGYMHLFSTSIIYLQKLRMPYIPGRGSMPILFLVLLVLTFL